MAGRERVVNLPQEIVGLKRLRNDAFQPFGGCWKIGRRSAGSYPWLFLFNGRGADPGDLFQFRPSFSAAL